VKPSPLSFSKLGKGGIGGFFIGYATRKVVKVALILAIVVFSLIFLAYTNVIGIDYDGLAKMVPNFASAINTTLVLLTPLVSHLPFVGSLIIGFVIGFKKK
jgi:uncharacterized membrane protein (Fun14 family)